MSISPTISPTTTDQPLFVLHARPLRSGTTLDDTSRFDDDIWSLDPAILQPHQGRKILNFPTIPTPYQHTTKELFLALLSGELPVGETRRSIQTIRSMFTSIKTFTAWLAQRPQPTGPLRTLTAADLVDYQKHLLADRRSYNSRQTERAAIRLFWTYRDALSDHLTFDPAHLDNGWQEARTTNATENATARIPEEVLGPLLVWSMRFVRDFAPDILRVWNLRRTQSSLRRSGRTRRPTKDVEEALKSTMDGYVTSNIPIPGTSDGRPNRNFIAALAGVDRSHLDRNPTLIDEAIARVGLSNQAVYDHRPIGLLDNKPWTTAIVHDTGDIVGLARLCRILQASCYVVIAYLSGMRDSEIKSLRHGSITLTRDSAGNPHRWHLTSLAFKGIGDHGAPATWVVGKPVADAITVLEQLQNASDLLFTVLPNQPGSGASSKSSAQALSNQATNHQLRHLVKWINEYCARTNRHDQILHPAGPRLSTRQFRRTLAWFIARRPGGSIAGAIQYRHLSIQMFEGYAGTSDSGFRPEVESEQAIARGEHLLEMANQHPHPQLAGPAGPEAHTRLDSLRKTAQFNGTVLTDPQRIKRLMRRHDPAIYPGPYITCVFDPNRALCQPTSDSSGAPIPGIHSCQPLHCRNVALSSENTRVLTSELDTLTQHLASGTLPPLLARQLTSRRDELAHLLQPDQDAKNVKSADQRPDQRRDH